MAEEIRNSFRTIYYFKSSLLDPFLEVFRILNDPSNVQYKNLLDDLNRIDKTTLNEFLNRHNYVNAIVNSANNKDQEIRAYCLIDILQKEIAKERILALLDNSQRPRPYDSENLKNIEIDSEKLASIDQFNLLDPGFRYNKFVYVLLPPTPQLNSSYWLSRLFSKIMQEERCKIKIRLDPFIEKSISEYKPVILKELIYGAPLNWDKIFNLSQEDSGQFIDLNENSEIYITDYVWKPLSNETHFTCEELPKKSSISHCGSRYFHAILDKVTGKIKHCDGAIRIYSDEEYMQRINYHLKQPEVRKIGRRVKIFQMEDCDRDFLSKLATCFFVWNHDIRNYFSGKENES